MRIRQSSLQDLTPMGADGRRPWLQKARDRLRVLPALSPCRVLVAEEDGFVRAVLGLRMYWRANGRLGKAVICVLEVDPAHGGRGIGSRLVRFAEGIARIHGCARVDVAPGLEGWGEGRCWRGLGYADPGAGLHKELQASESLACG